MKINAIPRKVLIKSGFMFTSMKQVIKKKNVELMSFGGAFIDTWENTMETILAGSFCLLHSAEIVLHWARDVRS